jgi:glutathione-independent formaldehyde dehydrogenase
LHPGNWVCAGFIALCARYVSALLFHSGIIFGHEITGQVVEMGPYVERFDVGDFVSVPFNIACGKCDNCCEMKTSACLKVNDEMAGGAYGYAQMGGWDGGQAEYVLVPYADFNLLKLPADRALSKINSIAFLSDIYPTGMNGAVQAGVKPGSIVYIAGAGPVGLCAAQSAFLLGAAAVFISDRWPDRLKLAASIGCKTIDLTKIPGGQSDSDYIYEAIEKMLPPEKNGPHELVDCAIECVGFEACGCGGEVDKRITEQAINTCFKVVKAGGGIGIPGLYPPQDPKGADKDRKTGHQHIQFGVCWNKALTLGMGQCPVKQFNVDLLKTILWDRVDLGPLLNVEVIPLEMATEAYKRFDSGEAVKFVFDPHGMIGK